MYTTIIAALAVAYIVIGVALQAVYDAMTEGSSSPSEVIALAIIWPALLVVTLFVMLYKGIFSLVKEMKKHGKKRTGK